MLALALMTVGACSLNFDATSLGVPVTMASPAGPVAPTDSFHVNTHAVWAFWGIFGIKRPALNKSLATQLAGGKGVTDVKINTHSGFTDVLVTILTAGLIVPRSVSFQGVVTGSTATK